MTFAPTFLLLTIAILAALAPGIHAWVSGRQLVAAMDDPTFAERFFARSRALGATTLACIILAPAIAGGAWWWTVPILVLALLTGTYPSRRRIFEEHWGLGEYLRHAVFSGIGMLGFWMLLGLAPVIIAGLAGLDLRLALGAATLIAGLLVLCQIDYPRFWLAMHRATPLERPDLAPLIDAIVVRAKCPAPALHRFGAPGGHIMNALALPHRQRPAVAFGDTLLERLEPREIAAVFAHEVAHLEYFDARRLRRLGGVSYGLIAMSTALTAVLVVRAPALAMWLSLGILVTIVGTLASLTSRSQANETASDLRAVELTGDAAALISALTKLHLHLRLPRQWPHEAEANLSHPSLARRLRAIRDRAQVAPPALRTTTVARTPSATVRIALDDARAYWFEGLPADVPDDLAVMREHASSYRALSYDELSELRLVPSGSGRALKARDLDGKSWLVSIRTEDVPAIHDALSVVDARLGERRRVRAQAAPQLLAVGMLLALFAAGQTGVLLVPLIVLLVRPGIASLAAVGVMALARVTAALVTGDVPPSDAMSLAGVGGMVALAIVALLLVWRSTRGAGASDAPASRPRSQDVQPTLLGLTAIALLFAVLLGARGARGPVWELLGNQHAIALAVVGLGGAAVLGTLRTRPARRGGAALAVAALALLTGALNRAEHVLRPPMGSRDVVAERVAEVRLENGGYRLELSSDARHYAVQTSADYEDESGYDDVPTARWTVGAFDGGSREIPALDLAFVDEDRLVAVQPQRGGVLVTLGNAMVSPDEADAGGWSRMLPGLAAPQLFVNAAARRWSVVGRSETGDLVAFSGAIDDEGNVIERRWKRDSLWVQPMHVAADGTLLGYSFEVPRGGAWSTILLATGASMTARMWELGESGRVSLGSLHGAPQCGAAEGGVVCIGRTTGRTHVWAWAGRGAPASSGVLPRGWEVWRVGHGGSIVAIDRPHHRMLVVDPLAGTARQVSLRTPNARGPAMMLDAWSRGPTIATLEAHGDGTRIGVYRAP